MLTVQAPILPPAGLQRGSQKTVTHTLLKLEIVGKLPARSHGFVCFRRMGVCYVPPSDQRWSIAQRLPVFPHPTQHNTYLLNHRVYRTWTDRAPAETRLDSDEDLMETATEEAEDF